MSSFKPLSKAQKQGYAMAMKKKAGGSKKRYPVRRRAPYPVYRKRYYGRGDYKSTIGGRIGGEIGSALGFGAQKLIKYLTGFGDYSVTTNSIMGGTYSPPALQNLRDRSVVVRHREYICDINASAAFTLQSFPINPGLFTSFPWLAQVAEAFEEYYITGMVYEYKTLSADYTTAASAALGYVVMSTQYNVLNPDFPDKITMENYEFSNSAKPSDSFIHPIECKKSVNPVSELYVRTGDVPSSADARLYDLGKFQIATGGNSGTGVIGELWCTYEIVFCKPKLVESIGYDLLTDHFRIVTANNSNPFGTASLPDSENNLGGTLTSTVYAFPPNIQNGYYLFNYVVIGNSTALTGPTFTGVNCTVQQVWNNNNTPYITNTGSTSIQYIAMFIMRIDAAKATLTVGTAGTLPASITGGDLWVTQINPLA